MAERAGSSTDRSPLILASASPRRRWLLAKLDVPFEVLAQELEERQHPDETAVAFAQRMADEKAAAAAARRPQCWVLAADTVVSVDAHVLGKPRDAADARAMLARLAGRAHVVITAMTLHAPDGRVVERAAVETRVRFRAFRPAEIDAYVASGEPFDKAGAYAIQGEGAHLVDRVEGSYTNVIGLPLAEVAAWLERWQIR